MTLTLPEIEAKVQALEQQIQADQLSPGVFSLNPTTGALEEKLKGRLEAEGIVFNIEEIEELTRSIVWEAGLEALRASIVGEITEGKPTLALFVKNAAKALASLNLSISELSLVLGGQERILLNNLGQSSFPQLETVSKLKLSWGVLNGKGEILIGSGDYTTHLEKLGSIEVKWKTPKEAAFTYGVLASPISNEPSASCYENHPGAGVFYLRSVNAAGELLETDVVFLAFATT
ncbi:MAG TPA: hypothetical protein VKG78_02310 [Opitutaceae bacterium]|nr:hypothetical protein [Opitutaceae bacterium]